MRMWLNGRQRDVKISPAARSAGLIAIVLFYVGTNQGSTLIGHGRLDWWFWGSMVLEMWVFVSATGSLIRQIRAGDRIRVVAKVISDPSAS